MPAWAWPLIGGLAGSAAVLAFAVPAKISQLKTRGQEMQRALEAHGGPSAAQVQAMQDRLRVFATTQAAARARAEADRFLLAGYGLDQRRMQRIDELTRMLNTLMGR